MAKNNNSDNVEFYSNLRKAQRRWGMLAKVLGEMVSSMKSQSMMYKALVQTVLLYGSEIWVVTDTMMTVLEGFHHRIARCVLGITARWGNGGEWEWASVDAKLEATGIWLIREYMRRGQATISEYFTWSPIY